MKKKLIGIFIFMLLICTVLPASANVIVDRTYNSINLGNTLYVGGSGPNNYTRIQDAINDARNGDTVYVYKGTYNSILIDKSITLLGENKYTTIIDASGEYWGVRVYADGISISGISISGFTIKYANMGGWGSGIKIDNKNFPLNDIIIHDNILEQNYYGIDNNDGYCRIYNNIIIDNYEAGIYLIDENTYVTNNVIMNNPIGIVATGENSYIICNNQIKDNEKGIYVITKIPCTIMFNNFINNSIHALFLQSANLKYLIINPLTLFVKHKWRFNYWDDWKTKSPKHIIGEFSIYITCLALNFSHVFIFDSVQYDWHPALEPYNI